MSTVPMKGDPKYIDYIVQLAKTQTLRKGVINEPRIFFDEIPQNADSAVMTAGTAGVFIHGEQFPVRLTHLVACVRFLDQDDAVDDPRNVNRILLNMLYHDQFYMNRVRLPVPVWGNKVVAASESFSDGNAHWDLVANSQPFVMSARDTIEVQVQLRDAANPQTAVPVDVVLHGVGMLSHRPFILNGRRELADLTVTALGSTNFRNDGSEPIVITDVTAFVGAELGDDDPTGNINRVSLNIRQRGNGTNSWWFQGPAMPPAISRMQATLLGITTGRAVVHQLPGDGFLWNPGDGLTVQTQAAVDDLPSVLCLGLAGYLMVR